MCYSSFCLPSFLSKICRRSNVHEKRKRHRQEMSLTRPIFPYSWRFPSFYHSLSFHTCLEPLNVTILIMFTLRPFWRDNLTMRMGFFDTVSKVAICAVLCYVYVRSSLFAIVAKWSINAHLGKWWEKNNDDFLLANVSTHVRKGRGKGGVRVQKNVWFSCGQQCKYDSRIKSILLLPPLSNHWFW